MGDGVIVGSLDRWIDRQFIVELHIALKASINSICTVVVSGTVCRRYKNKRSFIVTNIYVIIHYSSSFSVSSVGRARDC
jgi:hypothetical protein